MAIYTIDTYLQLNVWEQANTSSYVTLAMQLQKATVGTIRNVSGTLKLGGRSVPINLSNEYSGSGTVLYTVSGVSPPYNGNATVTSTVSFIGTYEIYAPGPGTWISQSASFTDYYTATRPVQPAISTSATTVTLGSSVSITTSGGSSGSMTWRVGSHTGTVATFANETKSWTPALATFAPYNPTGTSMTCTLTWNGATKNITLTIPSNSSTNPTASVAMSINSGGLAGLYVQNQTTAKATVSTTTKYGATITNYSISLNGVTYNSTPAVSGPLKTSGSNTCSVTVTDSRGFTATASASFTVQAYSNPTISNLQIFRSNSSGTAKSDGTYLRFAFTPAISSVLSNNAKGYRLEYREVGGAWTAVTGTLSSYTSFTPQTVNAGLSTTTLYEARVGLTDSFHTHAGGTTVYSTIISIPTDEVMMDFNSDGDGGGIGMYTQAAGHLDVAWDVITHGGIKGGTSASRTISDALFNIPGLTYTDLSISLSADNTTFATALFKWLAANFPHKTRCRFMGVAQVGSYRMFNVFIYDTDVLSGGIPRYGGGTINLYTGYMGIISLNDYTVTVKMITAT